MSYGARGSMLATPLRRSVSTAACTPSRNSRPRGLGARCGLVARGFGRRRHRFDETRRERCVSLCRHAHPRRRGPAVDQNNEDWGGCERPSSDNRSIPTSYFLLYLPAIYFAQRRPATSNSKRPQKAREQAHALKVPLRVIRVAQFLEPQQKSAHIDIDFLLSSK